MAFKKDPLAAMKFFRENYGYLPYFGGPLKTLFIFHPDEIKKILVDERHNNEKGDQAKLMTVALGDSLFIAEGEKWRQKKTIIQKVFHHQAILNYSPLIASITEKYTQEWKAVKTVNLTEEIMSLSFQISAEIFFGGVPEAQGKKIRTAFHLMGKIVAKKFASPIRVPFSIPTPDNLELKKQLAILDQFIYQLIAENKKNGISGENFLGKLMTSAQNLSDKQIRDEVVTFMGAGYETTATFIIWTLYELLKHPDFLERFKTSPHHSIERKNILQEGLRLYPSFPINVRQNIEPVTLAEQTIAPRTNLLFSPFITQRDPRFWKDPETFNPDRFLSIDNETLRYQFIPFMVGPKKCIGEQLAYEIAEVVLEVILNNLEFELQSETLHPLCDILLYSDKPLIAKIV